MSMRMLIDARHPEETRVAVVKGNRIEEFDFESAEHKQLKGNIYLAKVTRVEPSLQAAFVDYGGNRHGFLAFSEIHPDYYQIPKADRERCCARRPSTPPRKSGCAPPSTTTMTTTSRRSTRRSPTTATIAEATRTRRRGRRPKPAPARTARRSTNAPPTSFAGSARTCAAATRSRT